MSRRPDAAAQAEALRSLANELEAGTRELSRPLAKALDRELRGGTGVEDDELAPEDWEKAWADEINQRVAAYRAGKAQKVDLGAVLEDLRAKLS